MQASLSRLLAVARKEVIQFRRDYMTLAMMLLLPLGYLIGFGYAISTDVRHIPLAVFDQDHSSYSRDLVQTFVSTGFFDRAGVVTNHPAIEKTLRRGDAKAVLVIPAHYHSDVLAGRETSVQLVLDGSDPQSAGTALSVATGVVQDKLRQTSTTVVVDQRPQLAPVTWYNPDLRSQVYIVPALVGVILNLTMVVPTAVALVRERESGTRELLLATPIRGHEMVLGKILPFVALGYVQISVVMLAGRLIFGVPVVGSLGLVYALATPFILANLGIGFLFSTFAKSQLQVMQMTTGYVMPNVLLSGFLFPVAAMPVPAQWFSEVLPLHHFLKVVRGIILKGSELADLTEEVAKLSVFVAVSLFVSIWRVRRKVL
ncbi:MAG: ABC transporter permease [Proteobacteria bacterium]|nr:ABC transporter permease [Pseudomonadota bacterium]